MGIGWFPTRHSASTLSAIKFLVFLFPLKAPPQGHCKGDSPQGSLQPPHPSDSLSSVWDFKIHMPRPAEPEVRQGHLCGSPPTRLGTQHLCGSPPTRLGTQQPCGSHRPPGGQGGASV